MEKTKPAPPQTPPPQTLRQFLHGPPRVSHRALAKLIGVDPSYVSLLARGKRHPRSKLLLRLHEITGVPLDALASSRQRRKRAPPPAVEAAAPA